MSQNGWIGVDLDGTLAHYDGWKGPTHIGAPVPAMVDRVKKWLADGRDVRIFTARVATLDVEERSEVIGAILLWCDEHIGAQLAITNLKDFGMIELWDDRCVQVAPNTGKPYGPARALDVSAAPRPVTIRYSRDGKLFYVEGFECHRPSTWLALEKDADGKYPAYPFMFYEIKSGEENQVDADHELVKLYAECERWPTFGSAQWRESLIRQMEHHRLQRVEAQRSDDYHLGEHLRLHALFTSAFTNDAAVAL